jgi:hypothetical protein
LSSVVELILAELEYVVESGLDLAASEKASVEVDDG